MECHCVTITCRDVRGHGGYARGKKQPGNENQQCSQLRGEMSQAGFRLKHIGPKAVNFQASGRMGLTWQKALWKTPVADTTAYCVRYTTGPMHFHVPETPGNCLPRFILSRDTD